MALKLFGNVIENQFEQAANIAVGSITKGAFLVRFTHSAGSGAFNVMAAGNSSIGRIRINSSGDITRTIYTDADTIGGVTIASVDQQEYTLAITVDCDAGEGKFFNDGVQAGPTETLVGTNISASGNTKFSLFGCDIDGVDFVFATYALWIGSIPTPTDIADFESGTALASLSVPPTHSYEATGDDTTYIPSVTDGSGSLDLLHVAGPIDTDNFPVADGAVAPPVVVTRDITLLPEATHQLVQIMAATTNTTEGESLGAPSISIVEDNDQFYVPWIVDTVNITLNSDLTITTDKNQTITFELRKRSKSTGMWSAKNITLLKVETGSPAAVYKLSICLGISLSECLH